MGHALTYLEKQKKIQVEYIIILFLKYFLAKNWPVLSKLQSFFSKVTNIFEQL